MATKEQTMTSNGLNFLAAVWVFVSPFVLGFSGSSAAMNNYILGVIIGVLALIGISSAQSKPVVWPSWLNIVAGLWLIVSPFFFATVTASVLWNNIILGIVVAALAAWGSTSTVHQMHA